MDAKIKIGFIGWAGFIIMLVLFLQRCGINNCPTARTINDTTTSSHWDTIPKEIKTKQNNPSGFIILPVPPVDTDLILQKYFDKYFYSQTIADTNIRATLTDTVSENKIIGKGFSYKLLKPNNTSIIINTTKRDTILSEPHNSIYAGGFTTCNMMGTSIGIGPQLSLVTKQNTLYHINYDLLQKRLELGTGRN